MSRSTPPLATEIEGLKNAYASLNQNDIPGFAKILDPQIIRIEPPDFPLGGTYQGVEAVMAHLSRGRGTWAEGNCQPERFIVAGDRIIVFLSIHVRLKNETSWIEGSVVDVFTFRNGKATEFRTFGNERQALEWIGAKA